MHGELLSAPCATLGAKMTYDDYLPLAHVTLPSVDLATTCIDNTFRKCTHVYVYLYFELERTCSV